MPARARVCVIYSECKAAVQNNIIRLSDSVMRLPHCYAVNTLSKSYPPPSTVYFKALNRELIQFLWKI